MGETTNSTATAEVPELTVNITVKGEYLPPPEIVFDDVVVEVFEEEEENYIGKIDESDNEYFEPVISKILVKAEVIVEVEPEISKSSGSPFGVLGDTGGITSIVIGGIIIMVSVLLLYKKQIRKVEREVRKEELKNQVLLRDESSMFVGGDAYRSSNEAMRNLRVTMSSLSRANFSSPRLSFYMHLHPQTCWIHLSIEPDFSILLCGPLFQPFEFVSCKAAKR